MSYKRVKFNIVLPRTTVDAHIEAEGYNSSEGNNISTLLTKCTLNMSPTSWSNEWILTTETQFILQNKFFKVCYNVFVFVQVCCTLWIFPLSDSKKVWLELTGSQCVRETKQFPNPSCTLYDYSHSYKCINRLLELKLCDIFHCPDGRKCLSLILPALH